MKRERRNHRRVVGAQIGRREQQTQSVLLAFDVEPFAKPGIDRHAAGCADCLHTGLQRRADCLTGQHVHDRLLKTRANVGDVRLRILAQEIQHRRLQSAEAEVVRLRHAAWKLDCLRITGLRKTIDLWAAGITELEKLCDFVERLTGRVVNRLAENPVLSNAGGVDENRVTAGHNQRHHRQRTGVVHHRRVQMRFHVVDRDEWLTGRKRDALAGIQADEQ